jgi:GTP-binding protein
MDKVSNNEKFRCLKDIRKKVEFHNDDVFFHSSLNDTGKDEILNYIDSLLIKEEIKEEA